MPAEKPRKQNNKSKWKNMKRNVTSNGEESLITGKFFEEKK